MNRLRPATAEEVEKIKLTSDLSADCLVLALDTHAGVALAVVRTAIEVDPVYFPDPDNTKMNAFFVRDIETFLNAKGVASYYFNIDPENEDWMKAVVSWGAEQVSKSPEIRFKKNL